MLCSKVRGGRAAASVVALSCLAAVVVLTVLGPGGEPVGEPYTVMVGVAATGATMGLALAPLYEALPRRPTTTIVSTQKHVAVGCVTLAGLGFVGVPHGLGPLSILAVGAALGVVLPVWFHLLDPGGRDERIVVVGDDPNSIRDAVQSLSGRSLGLVSPSVVSRALEPAGPVDAAADETVEGERRLERSWSAADGRDDGDQTVADGGTASVRLDAVDGVERVTGLSRLPHALRDGDIDTVTLAFRESDREEFFGALRTCRDLGLDVFAHERHGDRLLADDAPGDLVHVHLEPWGPVDRLVKRAFDVVVAGAALLALLPVTAIIVLAIKLEGEGPVFFKQERTHLFGETFTMYKFRTLKPKKGGEVGTVIDEDRHTRLGRFLRTTHFDEIPQLWSILTGKMSVVGPRPAQTALEPEFEDEAARWRRRWFVKPGLTGLAQINDATSQEPAEKLRYDLRYIRNQSFRFDLRILWRQIRGVLVDIVRIRR